MAECHDLIATVIGDRYPGLVHGCDFLVMHPVDLKTGGPAGDPFISRWMAKDIAQPKDEEIKAFFTANEARYRAIFVRASRDECLEWSDSKAIAAADAPAGIRTRIDAWAAYRQALRDVPQ